MNCIIITGSNNNIINGKYFKVLNRPSDHPQFSNKYFTLELAIDSDTGDNIWVLYDTLDTNDLYYSFKSSSLTPPSNGYDSYKDDTDITIHSIPILYNNKFDKNSLCIPPKKITDITVFDITPIKNIT